MIAHLILAWLCAVALFAARGFYRFGFGAELGWVIKTAAVMLATPLLFFAVIQWCGR